MNYKIEDIIETFSCDEETAEEIREAAKIIKKENLPF